MARHHYVMKAHLDKFVHPSTGKKLLYPYRRGLGLIPWRRKGLGPKGLGWAEDFYSQTFEDGSTSHDLDRTIQNEENLLFCSGKGDAGALSRCIFEPDFFPCKPEDRRAITVCAAFSRLRAPVQMHNSAMISELAANVFAFNQVATDDSVSYFAKELGITIEEARKKADEWKKQLLEGSLRGGVGESKERQDGLYSLTCQKHLLDLNGMRWRLLEAGEHEFFVTSDEPVVIEDVSLPRKRICGIKQSKTVEVWYPLSYRVGLLLDWRHTQQQGRFVANPSLARSLNRRMVKWCYKHVYSPLVADWLEDAVRLNKFNPLLDRFTSLEEMVESSQGNNIVDMMWALENGETADVFAGVDMH